MSSDNSNQKPSKNWFKGEGDWLKESYNDINNEDLFELGLKYEKN
ncbi:MAG: hypothetical protein CM15mP70_09610 [Pelagibacteraceae bacterium]|nr:MAG: hypothetical protein CM15mP70_09610 [Pelagibacteraceae bacterium]